MAESQKKDVVSASVGPNREEADSTSVHHYSREG